MAPRKTLLLRLTTGSLIHNNLQPVNLKGTWSFIVRKQRSNFPFPNVMNQRRACHKITIECFVPKLVVVTHGLMFVQVQINQTVPFVKGNWCMGTRKINRQKTSDDGVGCRRIRWAVGWMLQCSTAGHKSCLFAHQHIYPNVHKGSALGLF